MRSEPARRRDGGQVEPAYDGGLSVGAALLALCVGAVSTFMAAGIAIGQTSAAARSVLQGAYTEDQAVRGQSLYNEYCLECHGETMAGLDQAPPLVGPQFTGTWVGEPLLALVDRLGTMPPARPGSLTRSQNVDILAYMLWYNGLPIGEMPLDGEKSVLERMTFQTPLPTNP